jgi:hypothetical protein
MVFVILQRLPRAGDGKIDCAFIHAQATIYFPYLNSAEKERVNVFRNKCG